MSPWQAFYCAQGRAVLDLALPDAELAQRIAAHLAACAECCQAEASVELLVAGWRAADAPALPAEVEARLLARLCADR